MIGFLSVLLWADAAVFKGTLSSNFAPCSSNRLKTGTVAVQAAMLRTALRVGDWLKLLSGPWPRLGSTPLSRSHSTCESSSPTVYLPMLVGGRSLRMGQALMKIKVVWPTKKGVLMSPP